MYATLKPREIIIIVNLYLCGSMDRPEIDVYLRVQLVVLARDDDAGGAKNI